MITLQEAEERVERINAMAGDSGLARRAKEALKENLYAEALRTIADGYSNSRALAEIVLTAE